MGLQDSLLVQPRIKNIEGLTGLIAGTTCNKNIEGLTGLIAGTTWNIKHWKAYRAHCWYSLEYKTLKAPMHYRQSIQNTLSFLFFCMSYLKKTYFGLIFINNLLWSSSANFCVIFVVILLQKNCWLCQTWKHSKQHFFSLVSNCFTSQSLCTIYK